MSNWNDLSPSLRAAIRGQADKQTWPSLSEERQQELIDQAKTSMQRMRQSGQMKTVTETPSQRTERKDSERQERAAQREKDRAARAKEREEMRRGIMKASGGLVGGQNKLDKNKDGNISGADFAMMRKNYAYGGRVAKMSAEKS